MPAPISVVIPTRRPGPETGRCAAGRRRPSVPDLPKPGQRLLPPCPLDLAVPDPQRPGAGRVDHRPALLELQPALIGMDTATGQKLLVRAVNHRPPAIHDHDPVGPRDGGQAVRDHQRHAPFVQPVKRIQNHLFRLRIQYRGGPVQKQDNRVASHEDVVEHRLHQVAGRARHGTFERREDQRHRRLREMLAQLAAPEPCRKRAGRGRFRCHPRVASKLRWIVVASYSVRSQSSKPIPVCCCAAA